MLTIITLAKIDVSDWRENTKYGNMSGDSELAIWFWQIVANFSDVERVRLLQFSTGTSRVPVNGFAALRGKQQSCYVLIIQVLMFLIEFLGIFCKNRPSMTILKFSLGHFLAKSSVPKFFIENSFNRKNRLGWRNFCLKIYFVENLLTSKVFLIKRVFDEKFRCRKI